MNTNERKKQAAEAALDFIEADMIVGVGTGSTVNYFIDALARVKGKIDAAVASSSASAERLRQHGIPLLDANAAGPLPLYIDGADECTRHRQLIKGGGGALTGEKILAAASEKFVCIIDQSKRVDMLGVFPLPVEVIPMARSLVGRELLKHGGQPVLREGFVSDHGNPILDVHNLQILQPARLESDLNNIPGVVTVGLFALRPADAVVIAGENGIEIF